eukprot:9021702-Alexandrium_andersonii.AAC.1
MGTYCHTPSTRRRAAQHSATIHAKHGRLRTAGQSLPPTPKTAYGHSFRALPTPQQGARQSRTL